MFKHHREEAAKNAAKEAADHADMLRAMAEAARTFRGFDPANIDRNTLATLKAGEHLYAELGGAILIEPRSAGGHWEGRSQGVSIPLGHGFRYRVGASKGHYVKEADKPTVIDTGTAIVTDKRAFFTGAKQTREWRWDKCLGITHAADAPWTVIAVSNRQKASGIGYDREHADLCRFRIDLAYAVATGTADRLATELDEELAALAPPPSPPLASS